MYVFELTYEVSGKKYSKMIEVDTAGFSEECVYISAMSEAYNFCSANGLMFVSIELICG